MSTSNLELIEVSPSTVVFFTHGNIGGISLKNFLIVIDGGKNPERAKVFREEFENLFNLPVKYFVLTHRHTDHRYGAVAFKDCKFICSKKTAEIMPKNFKNFYSACARGYMIVFLFVKFV